MRSGRPLPSWRPGRPCRPRRRRRFPVSSSCHRRRRCRARERRGAGPTPAAAATPEPRPGCRPGLPAQAISQSEGQPVAVLSNRVVHEGDHFDGVTVLRIGADEVEIEVKGQRRTPGSDGGDCRRRSSLLAAAALLVNLTSPPSPSAGLACAAPSAASTPAEPRLVLRDRVRDAVRAPVRRRPQHRRGDPVVRGAARIGWSLMRRPPGGALALPRGRRPRWPWVRTHLRLLSPS